MRKDKMVAMWRERVYQDVRHMLENGTWRAEDEFKSGLQRPSETTGRFPADPRKPQDGPQMVARGAQDAPKLAHDGFK